MGAWIETASDAIAEEGGIVAPCMGAWIETPTLSILAESPDVAPCMGAWIETWVFSGIAATFLSHPVWVRGLKLTVN